MLTPRLENAVRILTGVLNNLPYPPMFRTYSEHRTIPLPQNVFALDKEPTGLIVTDCLIAYWKGWYGCRKEIDLASEHHFVTGMVAGSVVRENGWSKASIDAITLMWAATVGLAACEAYYHKRPPNLLAMYADIIEQGEDFNFDWSKYYG